MKTHAQPLIVRKERVVGVLLWLKHHNPYYKDVTLNLPVLDCLDEVQVLPVHSRFCHGAGMLCYSHYVSSGFYR